MISFLIHLLFIFGLLLLQLGQLYLQGADVLLNLLKKDSILVVNKSDLTGEVDITNFDKFDHILISIKDNINLDNLVLKIKNNLKINLY